jgi:hypothetical protein
MCIQYSCVWRLCLRRLCAAVAASELLGRAELLYLLRSLTLPFVQPTQHHNDRLYVRLCGQNLTLTTTTSKAFKTQPFVSEPNLETTNFLVLSSLNHCCWVNIIMIGFKVFRYSNLTFSGIPCSTKASPAHGICRHQRRFINFRQQEPHLESLH